METGKPYLITGNLQDFERDYIQRYFYDKTVEILNGTIDRQNKIIESLYNELNTLQSIGLSPKPRKPHSGKVIKLQL